MDRFLMKYLNNKYALTLCGTQLLTTCSTPLSVLDWETNWPMILPRDLSS